MPRNLGRVVPGVPSCQLAGANQTEHRRRAISLSYLAGWLRTVEDHMRNLGRR